MEPGLQLRQPSGSTFCNDLPMVRITVSDARSQLDDLVRRVSLGGEIIALTDHGHATALLVSPRVVEDLEDALAVAERLRHKAEQTLEEGIPMIDVRKQLGPEQR